MPDNIQKNVASFITEPNPQALVTDEYWVLDLETTILDHGHARNPGNHMVLGVARSSPALRGRTVALDGQLSLQRWAQEEIINKGHLLVAHNTKFELAWLQRAGIDTHHIFSYCTMIGEYVLGERGKVYLLC